MQSKSAVLLKVMLNRYHPGAAQSFLKYLPQVDAKEAADETTQSTDLQPAFNWPNDVIARAHYSWLAPVVKTLPGSIQGPTLAALPESQAESLSKLLDIPIPKTSLSPASKAFLVQQLYNKWQPQDALPVEYLPQSQLAELLTLSKSELVVLIDLLAMHDLADAIRHIVDKKYLKNIYFCLKPQELQFLKICLHKKEKLSAPKLEIEKWDGSPYKLHTILHKRGMLRLGTALCGQGKQFLWHITHILDTGRGSAVAKYYQDSEIPNTTPLLALQVLSVINFLKGKSEA